MLALKYWKKQQLPIITNQNEAKSVISLCTKTGAQWRIYPIVDTTRAQSPPGYQQTFLSQAHISSLLNGVVKKELSTLDSLDRGVGE